jgi:hypothetical protein
MNMVPRLGVTLVHWAPRAACDLAALVWRHVAGSLASHRVSSGAHVMVVDGSLVATHVGVDAGSAPALRDGTTVTLVAEAPTHFDVYVAGASLAEDASVRVDRLAEGVSRPLRWQRAIRQRLGAAQCVVGLDSMHCESTWRVHVPAVADGCPGIGAYRLTFSGARGDLTRVAPGRALFPNGPFAAEMRAAKVCVRVPNADVFVDAACTCAVARAGADGVLALPLDAPLVLVRYASPAAFSHLSVPASYSVKALLCDGSVVHVTPSECGCAESDPAVVPLAFPLVSVAELRFRREPACECADTLGALLGERLLRVVREPDGSIALLACAPIIVA